jgi:DNA-binding HxlR family transcriptional regulator
MIQSVASIRRLQKPADLRGQADLVDYDLAYPLLLPLVLRQLSRITDVDVESLRSVAGSHMDTFTTPQAAELWGISERQARRRLRRLESAGLIAETDSSRKNRNEYRLTDKEPSSADTGLPTPDALREAVAEREAIQQEPPCIVAPTGDEMSDEP